MKLLITVILIIFQGCFIEDTFKITDKLFINPEIPMLFKTTQFWLDKSEKKIEFNKNTVTVEKYLSFVKTIKYKRDPVFNNAISSPEAIIERGYGDCDDYAMLAYWNFGKSFECNGKIYKYDSFYVLIDKFTDLESVHVVLRYTSGNNVLIFDNDKLRTDDYILSKYDYLVKFDLWKVESIIKN